MSQTQTILLLVGLVLLALCCCCVNSAPPSSESSPSSPSSKVRQTRGFRNSALATARGFGKRTFSRDFEPALSAAMADNSAISTSWLSDQMSKNPEIARLIVERFVDTDGDGLVTMEDLMRSV